MLCKTHLGSIWRGKVEAAMRRQPFSSQGHGGLRLGVSSGDREKRTFKKCSGGRMQGLVTDEMWCLEKEAAQIMLGFEAWVMGRLWCFSMMWGGVENQVRERMSWSVWAGGI